MQYPKRGRVHCLSKVPMYQGDVVEAPMGYFAHTVKLTDGDSGRVTR